MTMPAHVEVKVEGEGFKEIAGSACHGAPLNMGQPTPVTVNGSAVTAPFALPHEEIGGYLIPYLCSECGSPTRRVVTGTAPVSFSQVM